LRSFLRCGVVHGAGRMSDIEDLRLEKAEVKIGKGAIAVDKYMRTQIHESMQLETAYLRV
jgi:hypothetical protein